jgi:DNA (cytosine-5)-methyltransferase 1
MKALKILNLYSGIGGNRKLWSDIHDITAVENDPEVLDIYVHNFPKDRAIQADAHQFLLENYAEYDFIWSSPPCPSHSKSRFARHTTTIPIYPDLKLYQEIIYLMYHFKGKWLVENVLPYYTPLIPPTKQNYSHLFWSNYRIGNFPENYTYKVHGKSSDWEAIIGLSIEGFPLTQRRDKILRNCVNPKVGEYLLNCAMDVITQDDVEQLKMF